MTHAHRPFSTLGLVGKPAHKAPQETPYDVEVMEEEEAPRQGVGMVPEEVMVTHTINSASAGLKRWREGRAPFVALGLWASS
jgi:hypothetical protein